MRAMNSREDLAFKQLVRELYAELKPTGFKRFGQRFARENGDIWQVIGIQRSLYASSGEKILTLNFGIAPKAVLRFRKEDVTKPPRDFTCSIQGRISAIPPATRDKWWTVTNENSANAAVGEITGLFQSRVLPFLNRLQTNAAILTLYESGKIYGWEIEANEARLIMLAAEKNTVYSRELLIAYAEKWLPTGARQRAEDFIRDFNTHFA